MWGWGNLWGAGVTEILGNGDYSGINDSLAFLIEAQKDRRKSGAGVRGVLIPSLPSLSISLLKHCCSHLSGQ